MIQPLFSYQYRPAVIILCTICLYFFYYYFAHSGFLKSKIASTNDKRRNEIYLFFFRKLSGFLILGLIPAFLYSFISENLFEQFGLTVNHLLTNSLIIIILVVIIACLLFLYYKKSPSQNSPQINIKNWDRGIFIFNAVLWSLYLIAYEFLFRGILLFECCNYFGFWTAIAINISIYSAIHMVYGKNQALGSLIFGSVSCFFALRSGTLFIPIFMHLSLSIFSDYFSIRLNPNLNFVKQNH